MTSPTFDFINEIHKLEPFGQENPTPRFAIGPVHLRSASRVGEKHIRCRIVDKTGDMINAIAFNVRFTPLEECLLCAETQGALYIAGFLNTNTFKRVSVVIEDIYKD